jgi:hypothetical protein
MEGILSILSRSEPESGRAEGVQVSACSPPKGNPAVKRRTPSQVRREPWAPKGARGQVLTVRQFQHWLALWRGVRA